MSKLIVLGLDGLEPTLLARYFAEGRCPNLKALADSGGYRELATTTPSESPVAWSSFITGQNPGRHGIFDFLHRDPRNYTPRLSIAQLAPPKKKSLELGPWLLPMAPPQVIGGRKGTPFWHAVAAAGVPTTVVRVPVTYPPEPFDGKLLASMGVPDLHGSQGSYSYWTTDPDAAGPGHGGDASLIAFEQGQAEIELKPMPDPFRIDQRPVSVGAQLQIDQDCLRIRCDKTSIALKAGQWSEWCKVRYRFSLAGSADGWVRWYLQELSPYVRLYCSPVNIDPARPSAPLSHPPRYAAELQRAIGPYATLGMAEDTWVLNEKRMDEEGFLAHCQHLIAERTRMLDFEMARFKDGLLICVYDQPDRLQHMFWHVEDAGHPAHKAELAERYRNVLRDLYEQLDGIVGKIRCTHPDADLMVMSDHGCKSFRRSFHVNRWLAEQGYLVLKDGAESTDPDRLHFDGVDWSRTQAYAIGLVGIFVNLRGREAEGSVAYGAEADRIKREIRQKLTDFRDAKTGEIVANRILPREEIYTGPQIPDAPDLILAYNAGYRASWQTALGGIPATTLEDNLMAWSGDHCIDARLVPGVLLSTRKIESDATHIMDIAPSVLAYFGVAADKRHEGKAFWS